MVVGVLVDTTGNPLSGTEIVLGIFEGMAEPSQNVALAIGESGVIEKMTYRVSGLEFSISNDPDNGYNYSTTTDEKGTFRIGGVPPGDYVLLTEKFRLPLPDLTPLLVKGGVSGYIFRIEAGKVYDLGEIEVR
jgi:hypothetical protein